MIKMSIKTNPIEWNEVSYQTYKDRRKAKIID
jgi:hypothetical protein